MRLRDREFLQDYVEKLDNQLQIIRVTKTMPNAPVDATQGLEAELQRHRAENRDRLLDVLAKYVVEHEAAHHLGEDDGR